MTTGIAGCIAARVVGLGGRRNRGAWRKEEGGRRKDEGGRMKGEG
jgi:hypothetical protein